ncbi:hypothetical protein CYMTET_33628, partial [Cymbomonas tetramitiformis]
MAPKRLLAEEPDKSNPIYTSIHKLFSVLRGGNQTGIIFALCQLEEIDLADPRNQLTVLDAGGVDVLLLLMKESKGKLRLAAAQILLGVVKHPEVQFGMTTIDKLTVLLDALEPDCANDILEICTQIIEYCAAMSNNRYILRQLGGVPKLMMFLEKGLPDVSIRLLGHVAFALAALCRNDRKVQGEVQQLGGLEMVMKLLHKLGGTDAIPIWSVIRECLLDEAFRTKFRLEGGVLAAVEHLHSPSPKLQSVAAAAIAQNGDDVEACTLLHNAKGLDPLITLITSDDASVVKAAAAALRCYSACSSNAHHLVQKSPVETLLTVLQAGGPELKVNILRILHNIAGQVERGRFAMKDAGAVEVLLQLSQGTNQEVCAEAVGALGECALEEAVRPHVHRLGGLKTLFSLLRTNNPQIL